MERSLDGMLDGLKIPGTRGAAGDPETKRITAVVKLTYMPTIFRPQTEKPVRHKKAFRASKSRGALHDREECARDGPLRLGRRQRPWCH